MRSIAEILVRPLTTEKSTTQLPTDSEYAFEVGMAANKLEVKQAIESFYAVEVADVRTLVVRGKVKRHGRRFGKQRNWKKAYVRLKDGHSINLFEA
ncbi:MAG: 50S ribosomal protein L23 [Myxococcota bacterium]